MFLLYTDIHAPAKPSVIEYRSGILVVHNFLKAVTDNVVCIPLVTLKTCLLFSNACFYIFFRCISSKQGLVIMGAF